MASEMYRFGPFELDVLRARVTRDGTELSLRPQAFDLLRYLLNHADRLVTRDELMQALWPDVVVTDDSLSRCVSDVRSALGDGDQALIRTVARRGYRFVARVDCSTGTGASPAVRAPSETRRSRLRWPWAMATLTMLAALVAALALLPRAPAPLALSLVVLPFAAPDDDRSAKVVGHLLTEALTAALARVHGTRIISAASASRYQGGPPDAAVMASELGVRYILQGSVAGAGATLRVNASLLEAPSAKVVWVDQFELDPGDLPRLHDAIVMRVAHATATELVRDTGQAMQPWRVQDLAAEDLALRCEAASRIRQGESDSAAYAWCERALELDPRNARALVRLAMYHGDRVERMQSPDPTADLAKARAWVDRALAAAPGYDAVHCAHAVVLSAEGRVPAGVVAAQRCVELNPSNAYGYRILATLHYFLVEPERSLFYLDKGMLLSPRDPQLAGFMLFKGWALLQQQRDEEALVWLRKAANASPDSPSILAPLAATLALSGHDVEARTTLDRYLGLARTRSRTLAQWDAAPARSAAFERFADRFKQGLRKAGMPER